MFNKHVRNEYHATYGDIILNGKTEKTQSFPRQKENPFITQAGKGNVMVVTNGKDYMKKFRVSFSDTKYTKVKFNLLSLAQKISKSE